MSGIFEPSESINYNFVAGVYGFFSALCLVLLALHFYTPAVEGFYITLVPFLPCLLWSLVVRSKWLKQQEKEGETQATSADAQQPSSSKDAEAKKDK